MPLDMNHTNNQKINDELHHVLKFIQHAKTLSKNELGLIRHTIDKFDIMELEPLNVAQKYQEIMILYPKTDARPGLRLYMQHNSINCHNVKQITPLLKELSDNGQIIFKISDIKTTMPGSTESPFLDNLLGNELRTIIKKTNGSLTLINPKIISTITEIFTNRLFINEFISAIATYKSFINTGMTDIPAETWKKTMPLSNHQITQTTNTHYIFVLVLLYFITENHRI